MYLDKSGLMWGYGDCSCADSDGAVGRWPPQVTLLSGRPKVIGFCFLLR